MTGSANKPPPATKTARKRSQSLVVVKCDIANCGFSAKTTTTVKKHQREVHEIKPHNETTFNQSVSDSILDDTVDRSALGATDSLEHKTSTDFNQEVTNAHQSTQLASTGKKRVKRDSEDEDEGEEDKRRKLSTAADLDMSQTQGEKERQEVRDKAKATVSRKLQEEPLNASRSLLETSSEKLEDLDDDTTNEGDSLLLKTAEDTVHPVTDSLSLSYMTPTEDNEVKNLESQLRARDESLKQALAKIASLEANEGAKIRKIEYLENKISKKDLELKDSIETINLLTDQVDKGDTKGDTKSTKRITILNNKVTSLEKKLADAKAETAKYKDNAETQRTITEGFKMVQADLSAQIVSLKRDTRCKEENCTNSKECGRSHAHKDENKPQCDFFNYGRCKKGNECRYKHDPTVKQKFHDEEGKRKQEEKDKEEKAKDEERKKKEDEKKKEDKDEEDKNKKAKLDAKKEKMKRKRVNRKLRKTGDSDVSSTKMEVEADSAEDTSEPDKKKKKKTNSKTDSNTNKDKPKPPIQTPTPTTIDLTQSMPPPHPKQDANFHHTDLSRPPPPQPAAANGFHNPQIPPNFNFNQGPRFQSIPPSFTPNIHHNMPPANMPPPTLGGFSGVQQWPMAGWPGAGHMEMSMERARQEGVAQAQVLSRRARLDNIRAEIASLQSRIIASQSQPQGTVDIQALINQEAALKQHLYEQSY